MKVWIEPSGGGASVWVDSWGGTARHLLETSLEAVRWADSEGSLPLAVAGSLNSERIWRGDVVGGEHEYMGKGG